MIDIETLIGNFDVKTRSVHFYVQRNESTEESGVLRFQLARLNVGEAMNLATGIFTVPSNGIYHFEFSAVKNGKEEWAIYLQVNGVRIASSFSQVKITTGNCYVTGMLNASFRLKKGDQVNIFKDAGGLMDNEY